MEKRTEQLNENTLEKIKRNLERWDEMGEPRFYSVQVDGEFIVSRTNNPGELERVKGFLFHNSENVKICYYAGFDGAPTEEVTYTIQQKPKGQHNGLSGVEIDERIKQALESERRKWEHEQLKKELTDTKKDLAEAEQYIDKMEELVEELKSSRNKLGNVHVGEVVSVMVESFMRRNVDKIRKLPGGSTLAGILTESGESNNEPIKESEATYEKVNEQTDEWWADVQQAFSEKELDYVKEIIAHLANDKTKLTDVLSLLQPSQKQ